MDDYRRGDVAGDRESHTYEKVTKTHPHYAGRMDHTYLHDAEQAAIPGGYTVDLA